MSKSFKLQQLPQIGLVFSLLALPAARGESLDGRLNTLLANPQLKSAQVSMDIQEIGPGGGTVIFSHNATLALGPASNCKLLTTAAAFEKYGPGATFKTHLYQIGPDLVLVGGGDPGLGDTKIAGAEGQSPTSVFYAWAEKIKQLGIAQFRDLIVDDRVFDTQFVHPNWPADQRLDWYCARHLAGLNFNANCLDWTPVLTNHGVDVQLMPETTYVSVSVKATKGSQTKVSLMRPDGSNKFELRGTVASTATSPYSVPIYDPGLWTGTILRDVLTHSGIQQAGGGNVRRVNADEKLGAGKLLAMHETPILSVIERANTNSLNMMAECLCKRLGFDATGKPGSWASGTAAVEAYAAGVGAKADWVSLDDGSGLSNKNRVAARAFTTVLAHVGARADGKKFIETLAVPGEDGTLEKRFKGMKVAEHVHAKTGHITGVSTLSGYVMSGSRTFAFSILCNKYEGNVNPWQDEVCEALYEWGLGK